LEFFELRGVAISNIVGSILGLSSFVCWFSGNWWSAYYVFPYEQRFLAVILLCIALWVLVSNLSKEKRKDFSVAARREAIRKQKGKCARCKRKLMEYAFDIDHKNGDRSNNKLSNCQVLCVPCHRKKHVY
jgi:ABC-type nickel/cobalt efflux system permease component RcnA